MPRLRWIRLMGALVAVLWRKRFCNETGLERTQGEQEPSETVRVGCVVQACAPGGFRGHEGMADAWSSALSGPIQRKRGQGGLPRLRGRLRQVHGCD